MVKKVGMVAPMAVTLRASATESVGITHSPVKPLPKTCRASLLPRGVLRGPTREVGRVSSNRHGVIGTKVSWLFEEVEALTRPIPPPPSVIATAAPTAAQRVRNSVIPIPRFRLDLYLSQGRPTRADISLGCLR